jgi:hypothetical protein
MNRVRIALFKDWTAAKPIHERLLQAGIAAELHDEIWLARLWFVSKLSAGIRVEVPSRLSKRAVQLVLTWDAAEGALRDAIHCPECNSLRVDYPQFTRKSLVTNVALGLIAALGLVDKEYYCEDCHHTWPMPPATPRDARGHLAPNYFIEGLPQKQPRVTIGKRKRLGPGIGK